MCVLQAILIKITAWIGLYPTQEAHKVHFFYHTLNYLREIESKLATFSVLIVKIVVVDSGLREGVKSTLRGGASILWAKAAKPFRTVFFGHFTAFLGNFCQFLHDPQKSWRESFDPKNSRNDLYPAPQNYWQLCRPPLTNLPLRQLSLKVKRHPLMEDILRWTMTVRQPLKDKK